MEIMEALKAKRKELELIQRQAEAELEENERQLDIYRNACYKSRDKADEILHQIKAIDSLLEQPAGPIQFVAIIGND